MPPSAPHAMPDNHDEPAWLRACRLAFHGLLRNAPAPVVSDLWIDDLPTDQSLRDVETRRVAGTTMVLGFACDAQGLVGRIEAFRRLIAATFGEPDRWLEARHVSGVALHFGEPVGPIQAYIENARAISDITVFLIGVWGALDDVAVSGLAFQPHNGAASLSDLARLRADVARLDIALAEERRETLALRQRLAALEEPQWQRDETVKAIAREVWDEGRRRTLLYKIGKWFRPRR